MAPAELKIDLVQEVTCLLGDIPEELPLEEAQATQGDSVASSVEDRVVGFEEQYAEYLAALDRAIAGSPEEEEIVDECIVSDGKEENQTQQYFSKAQKSC